MENRRSSFEFEELLSCGRGEMFLEGPQLPLPPMLMFDRISEISETGGPNGKGFIRAEVVNYTELMALGSYAEVKAKGKLRLEGKEYLVKDGDILNIRFSPPGK